MREVYDYGIGVGGPIVRDRLWFYSSTRFWGGQNAAANNYFNKSPVFYRYEADLDRPAYTDSWRADSGGRFTLQASEKHKITSTLEGQRGCSCWLGISLGRTRPRRRRAPAIEYGSSKGSALGQLALADELELPGDQPPPDPGERAVPVPDGALHERPGPRRHGQYPHHGADDRLRLGRPPRRHPGRQLRRAARRATTSRSARRSPTSPGPMRSRPASRRCRASTTSSARRCPNAVNYVFQQGRPLQVQQFASPFYNNVRVRSLGLFAQDQWTINRLTLNVGVRYDHFDALSKAVTLPAGRFIGERVVPRGAGPSQLPRHHAARRRRVRRVRERPDGDQGLLRPVPDGRRRRRRAAMPRPPSPSSPPRPRASGPTATATSSPTASSKTCSRTASAARSPTSASAARRR